MYKSQSSKAAVMLKNRYRQNYLCSLLALLSPPKPFPWWIFPSSCFILVSILTSLSFFVSLSCSPPSLTLCSHVFIHTNLSTFLFCPILHCSKPNQTKHRVNKMNDFTCSKLIVHLMLFGTWNLSIGLGLDFRNSNFYLEKRKQLFSTHGFWENIIWAYPEG